MKLVTCNSVTLVQTVTDGMDCVFSQNMINGHLRQQVISVESVLDATPVAITADAPGLIRSVGQDHHETGSEVFTCR